MPWTGPSAYLTTIDEFIAHWQQVDLDLNPATMTLASGYALADLEADRAALAEMMADLEDYINILEAARTNRDTLKDPVKTRMRQLNNFIRGILTNSVYVGALPKAVQMRSNPGTWRRTMDDMEKLWTRIHSDPPTGFVPPLTLLEGYTLANYQTDADNLRAALTAVTDAQKDAEIYRKKRDEIALRIRGELGNYRAAVLARFDEEDPMVLSVPRLSPLPGHTPDPVVLSGSWNDSTMEADLSWTASDDSDLKEYQVRYCTGETYSTSLESHLETIPAGILSYSTSAGLTPGANRSYKVYVILNTDNEKGSNAVTIQNTSMVPPPPEP